jgi:hypothetical protein
LAGRTFSRRPADSAADIPVRALNYIRVPFVLCAFCFLIFFPLILGLSAERYELSTGLDPNVFLGRWLAICAVLFTGSAVLYAIRLRRNHSPTAGSGG